jgi:uncharacterized protein YraI
MIMRKRWLPITLTLMVLLIVPLLAKAQDAAPSPTPIPIIGGEEDDSAAPALPGGDSPTPAPSTTTEEGTGATTDGAITDSTTTSENQCPTLVQENFTLAEEFVCGNIQAGNVCAVSGTIDTVFAGDGTGSLSNPDDRVAFTSLDELGLRSTGTSNNAWAVVRGRLQLISTDGAVPVAPDMIAFGDLTMLDRGQVAGNGAAEGTVIAQRGMVVRRTPDNQGTVVWQLQPGEIITVTGITPDRQWIRMEIPSFYGGVGWVYSPYIEVTGGADALPFVTIESPAPDLAPPDFGPMQSILLITSPIADECGTDIPDSGLLLQSPNGVPDAVRYLINDVEVQFNGTIFIQAQAESTLSVTILEGTATMLANDGSTTGNAGARLVTSMDANLDPVGAPRDEQVDLSTFAVLPIRLLPRQVALGTNSAPANTSAPAENQTTTEQTTTDGGFGTPPPQPTTQQCIVTAPSEGEPRNVRSGPGLAYPVIRNLANNAIETADGQATGSANFVWYQLTDGGWIRFDSVTSEGPCDSLPVVQAPPPPQPTATPEPSEETSNPTEGAALASATLGAVTCPNGNITGSTTSDGSNLFVTIGGTWTANAGTSISVTTNGGQLRPELGSYIQLVAQDGTVVAESDDQTTFAFTFQQNTSFDLRLSAGNGDVVFVRVTCTG